MFRRIASVVLAVLVLSLFIFGQQSPQSTLIFLGYTAGSIAGAAVIWGKKQSRDEPVTWKNLIKWSIVGAAIVGGIIGAMSGEVLTLLSFSILGGLLIGGLVGSLLSLINYGVRGSLSEGSKIGETEEIDGEGTAAGNDVSADQDQDTVWSRVEETSQASETLGSLLSVIGVGVWGLAGLVGFILGHFRVREVLIRSGPYEASPQQRDQ